MPPPSDESGKSQPTGKDPEPGLGVEAIQSSPDSSADTQNGEEGSEEEIPSGLRLGYVGRLFGAEPEKAGNIVGFTIAGSFIILLAVVVIQWQITPRTANERGVGEAARLLPHFHVIITSLVSIITASLGYLFGESKRR